MKVLVLGGDARQIYCAGRLSLEPGYKVYKAALGEDVTDNMPLCDVLVLPYVSAAGGNINAPLSGHKVSVEKACSLIKNGGTAFCAGLGEKGMNILFEKKVKIYDWFDDEELTLKNAWLTAEGAAQIATKNLKSGLGGSKVLILGWGRVAKACSRLFCSMGAGVTVSARREEARLNARQNGFDTAEFIDLKAVSEADLIVNTVPATVLFERELEAVKKDGLILELASKPYGVDFKAAEKLNIRVNLASGIPGKYTPEAAGLLMAQSVINTLAKDGGLSG